MVVAPGAAAYAALHRRARRSPLPAAAHGGGWLFLAPHPDDEALGVGGLIAGLAAAGAAPTVAFLTDGAGSHVDAPGWSRARIARVRRTEARAALLALGGTTPPLHLDWPDAAPARPGEARFEAGVRRLAARCRRDRIGAIAVTWDGEPHCDHEAAAMLAAAVARRCRARLFHYLVWGWTDPALPDRTRRARVLAIDTAAWRPAQRRAMAQHRTQRGGRIAGGEGFRLPAAMMRLIDRRHTLLLEPRDAP